jgi:cytosine permease
LFALFRLGLGENVSLSQHEDYYLSAVPAAERKPFTAVLFPLVGYVFIFAVVLAGGLLGAGLYLDEALLAAFIAALILGVLAGVDGVVAADTGLTFGLLVRHSFGRAGAWLPNVAIPAIHVTWFGISVSFVAGVFEQVYGGSYSVYVVVMGLVFLASAYQGINMLVYLSYPIVLFCLVVGAYLIVGPISQHGGLENLRSIPPVAPIGMNDGITIAIGSFVTGATTASLNILRYCRSPIQGAIAGVLSMGVAFFFVLLIGIVGMKAAGTADVIEIGKAVGWYHLGVWMLILLTWTTLDKSLYASSLTFSASAGIPRTKVVLVLGILGIALGLLRSIDFIVPWLKVLGIAVPPLMGIIQADYWLARLKGRSWGSAKVLTFLDYKAVTIWALSIGVAWVGGRQGWTLSPVVVAIGLAVGLRALFPAATVSEARN